MKNQIFIQKARALKVFGVFLIMGMLLYPACDKETTSENPVVETDTTFTSPPPFDSIIYQEINAELFTENSQFKLFLPEVDANLMVEPLSFNKGTFSGTQRIFNMESHSSVEFLDLSNVGYLAALDACEVPSTMASHWKHNGQLANTVSTAGQFRGKNNRYLAFRLANAHGQYHYGWIRLSCDMDCNKLTISDMAIRMAPDSTVFAGQKAIGESCSSSLGPEMPIEQITDIIGNYHSESSLTCGIIIKESTDPAYDFTVQYFPFLWPYYQIPGKLSADGKLNIPEFTFSGNIPSPGGTPRPFSGYIQGSATLHLQPDGKKVLLWNISMQKTGFMPQSYFGDFWSEKCD